MVVPRDYLLVCWSVEWTDSKSDRGLEALWVPKVEFLWAWTMVMQLAVQKVLQMEVRWGTHLEHSMDQPKDIHLDCYWEMTRGDSLVYLWESASGSTRAYLTDQKMADKMVWCWAETKVWLEDQKAYLRAALMVQRSETHRAKTYEHIKGNQSY